jgi:mono/diheme cytochrome c family protein
MIGGTRRLTPEGALSMPAFGHAYSDDEIAAVANYVTTRFDRRLLVARQVRHSDGSSRMDRRKRL